MNKKNISPNPQHPVDRVPTGQLPKALAELSEESLGTQAQTSKYSLCEFQRCSYDGDDA